jgi:hypothetical protein
LLKMDVSGKELRSHAMLKKSWSLFEKARH